MANRKELGQHVCRTKSPLKKHSSNMKMVRKKTEKGSEKRPETSAKVLKPSLIDVTGTSLKCFTAQNLHQNVFLQCEDLQGWSR